MMGLSFMAIGIVLTIVIFIWLQSKKEDDSKSNFEQALAIGLFPFAIGVGSLLLTTDSSFLHFLGPLLMFAAGIYMIYVDYK